MHTAWAGRVTVEDSPKLPGGSRRMIVASTQRNEPAAEIEAWIVKQRPGLVPERRPFTQQADGSASLAVASLRALELASALRTWLGLVAGPTSLRDQESIHELARHLASEQRLAR
jgi:hypothetical protein